MSGIDPTAGDGGSTVHPRSGWRSFTAVTLIGAAMAAGVAWTASALSLAVWTMFTGFIAWYSRPTSTFQSVCSMICLWLGMGLAPLSFAAGRLAAPLLGPLTLPVSVFAVTFLVVALRTTKVVDNMLCWFLGFVTFSAAGRPPVAGTFADLILASAIGGAAGWVCQVLSKLVADED